MLNSLQNQLTDLLAVARSAMRSVESMMMLGKRPALVPVPVKTMVPVPGSTRGRQVSSVSCDRGYEAIAGINANAAVRLHADPVTEGWRSLDFGQTAFGNTRHSQPSRFAT
ncbi:MAG: hypothetical protein OES24_12535 [Acidimicrobiia bacterium]|nr:hypothetical protein [Acidimicrobiia bacterium]